MNSLQQAVKELYESCYWYSDEISSQKQAILWMKLRVASGIELKGMSKNDRIQTREKRLGRKSNFRDIN